MRTEGINLVYADLVQSDTQGMAFVDTGGTGEPLQVFKNLQKQRQLLEEYKKQAPEKFCREEFERLNQEFNAQLESIEKKKTMLYEDAVATENFMQNYIMDECHITIVVIGVMKSQDEKMINYISKQTERKHASKPVIVVHNYYQFNKLDHVREKI